MLSDELEYIECGERSRRSPEGELRHGVHADDTFGPLEGCGSRIHVRAQMFRCVECGIGFCKDCLLAHFKKSQKAAP